MAELSAKNTRIARTGGFYEAPIETEFPIDTTTPLPAAWKGWGWVGEDGITETFDSSSEDLKGWQDDTVIDSVNSESSASYTVPALETLPWIIETIYGTKVNLVDGSYEIDPGAAKVRKRFVYEYIDRRDNTKVRKMFEAQVSEIGEVNYTSTELVTLSPVFKVFGTIKVIDDKLKSK